MKPFYPARKKRSPGVGSVGGFVWAAFATFGAAACSSPDTSSPSCDLAHVPAQYCSDAHAMVLSAALPAARGNKYADNGDAATLGFYLFFDSNLGSGTSCATCHAPELAFTDRLSVSIGKDAGTRNAPTTFNPARLTVFFWDGRADSLWSQPLFPIENPVEIGSTRLALAQFIAANYQSKYEGVFGAMPDMSSWPATGKPGDPSFDGLSPTIQDQVNRIAANVGKALEAYMRKDATTSAPFDAFLQGDPTQIIETAQEGFGVFLSQGCQSCHSGPMLTDEEFHNVGFPSLADAGADPGRAGGLAVLQNNIFNLAGPYADPGPGVPAEPPSGSGEQGAFRTPSLRNVAVTFPYGHDGALATLADVLTVHAPGLTSDEQGEVIAFLATLNGQYPAAPWNNWPAPQ